MTTLWRKAERIASLPGVKVGRRQRTRRAFHGGNSRRFRQKAFAIIRLLHALHEKRISCCLRDWGRKLNRVGL